MGLNRRFKLIFTQEIITDDGCVVKEKPAILGQIIETERLFQETLVPEIVITETILNRLCEGVKAELRNPNACLNQENKQAECKEVQVAEPNIMRLNSQQNNV